MVLDSYCLVDIAGKEWNWEVWFVGPSGVFAVANCIARQEHLIRSMAWSRLPQSGEDIPASHSIFINATGMALLPSKHEIHSFLFCLCNHTLPPFRLYV